MALYDFLTLEGGGTKGFAYLGAAEELEKLGILKSIQAISGASVGSIAALLLATGWSVDKVKQEFMNMNFEEMVKGGLLGATLIPYDIFNNFGVFRATAFEQLFKRIIKEVTGNENCTFKQWHDFKEKHPDLGMKDLFIEACNVETKLNETFSHLSEHADVSIATAIRASMAFPGVFTQPTIKGVRYCDGGTQNNCPSQAFENPPGTYNPKTLTIRLDDEDEIRYIENGIKPPAKKVNNFIEAMIAVFGAATNSQNYDFQKSPYKETAILCDTLGVGTLEFNLTVQKQQALMASGQYSVIRYFHEKHPDLTKAYDKPTLERLTAAKHPRSIRKFFTQPVLAATTTKVPPLAQKADVTPLFQRWRSLGEFKDLKENIEPQKQNSAKVSKIDATTRRTSPRKVS